MRGAAGSDKSKHLEYTAYFWKGNINNIADFSWVITLSPPDLCFYPTGGLFKTMFLFKSMVYSGLSSCQTSRPASREYSPKSILVYFNKFKYYLLNITFKALYSLVISQWMSLLQVL